MSTVILLPNSIPKAIAPFSAVVTIHPIRSSIRFMSIRVIGSSSTTKTWSRASLMEGLDRGADIAGN